MAKKKKGAGMQGSVTAERAGRLYRLLKILSKGPQTRGILLRKLRLTIRGFYRDLETLREVGIEIVTSAGKYFGPENLDDAIGRLPFPDPALNLAEARQLSTGRSPAHKKIKSLLQIIEK
ncbi:MAG: hypothetical protein U0744_16745 [Gemmataceae bacterium]